MLQIRPKLLAQAQEAIAGTTEAYKSGTVLDKQYGDRNIAIMGTIQRMETLKLAHEPNYDKVEAVVPAVRKERMRLCAVGAEHHVFAS